MYFKTVSYKFLPNSLIKYNFLKIKLMKKNYTLSGLFMLGIFSSVYAQNTMSALPISGDLSSVPVSILDPTQNGAMPVITTQQVNDTLKPPSYNLPCASAITSYTVAANQYLFGTNTFPETECAQKYYASGQVSEVLVYFYSRAATPLNAPTSIKIRGINATTKAPSTTVLGTSAVITT